MLTVRRTFSFRTMIYNKEGKGFSICNNYDVRFTHEPGSGTVHANIVPDFEETTLLPIEDCDITWKSLLQAWQWCFRHAHYDQLSWAEIGAGMLDEGEKANDNGIPVIPVEKLSTGTEGRQDASSHCNGHRLSEIPGA